MSSTPFREYYLACQNGDLDIIQKQINSKSIYVTDDADPKTGMTGLHWAAMNNRITICDYLIKNGAKIDAITKKDYNLSGMTPLHIATKYGYIYTVHYLLNHGSDRTLETDTGLTLLHLAVQSSNAMNVIHTLLFVNNLMKIDVDHQDKFGTTALQMAIKQEDITSIKLLLQYGANVTIKDQKENSALKYAATRHNKNINTLLSRYLTKNSLNLILTDEVPDVIAFYTGSKYSIRNITLAKRITFMVPTLMLLIFAVASNYNTAIGLISVFICAKIADIILYRHLLPLYSYEMAPRRALAQSPIVSGLFFAILNCISFIWFTKLETVSLTNNFSTSVIFQSTLLVTYYLFVKIMRSNPGNIPQQQNFDIIRKDATTLINMGKFNDYYFCLETWLRKPQRSKFSDISQTQVARFDHYCSWVNNDIALLNHKSFVLFLLTLETSLISFIFLIVRYFNTIESFSFTDNLLSLSFIVSRDHDVHSFGTTFLLLIFVIYQAIYVVNVLIQQLYAISKGLTCLDIKILYELEKNSTVLFSKPFIQNDYFNIRKEDMEFINHESSTSTTGEAAEIHSCPDNSPIIVDNEYSKLVSRITSRRLLESRQPKDGKKDSLVKFFGFDMWRVIRHCNEEIAAYEDCELPNEILEPTRYGMFRNIKDFWLTAKLNDNIIKRLFFSNSGPIALLNGIPVDYYHLWKLPARIEAPLAVERTPSASRLV